MIEDVGRGDPALVRQKVRDAINRIRPLNGTGGWNKFTVDVDGWGLSATTRPELARMLWGWFNMPATDDSGTIVQ